MSPPILHTPDGTLQMAHPRWHTPDGTPQMAHPRCHTPSFTLVTHPMVPHALITIFCPSSLGRDHVELSFASGCSVDWSLVPTGSVICDGCRPAPVARQIQVELRVFEVEQPLVPGCTFELYVHAACTPAVLIAIVGVASSVENHHGRATSRQRPRALSAGTRALVRIEAQRLTWTLLDPVFAHMSHLSILRTHVTPDSFPPCITDLCSWQLETPLALERFEDCRPMGRAVLRHAGRTIAAGVITKLVTG